MTREEQIEHKAEELGQNCFPYERNIWARENVEAKCVEHAFIYGVKWSDEHPKEGLVSIDKVCEYLKSLVYQEFGGGPLERTFSDEDIEEFRKAMEE